ncbi:MULTISPECIES: ABC-F family ATP-binding cassette domain-containing protein [Anoxybacillus]|uniref:ABC transporter ATP-binding protein n=1 Tax=Anoxybacillus flavithermus TaxID=33934 RepID=A0A178TI29_9BACL|nr:ABC-F family ATP-binding cassette domain-containing protein [Anoxybacillus flavithermus]ASA97370.1 ABC transporter ATP-binding protein [Anoxybacillus flavithermus]ELK23123.1 ABC transporter ATPase [Anoxybacillus flavithermus TNO-09.006]MBE2906046.1 ABC-F family ATP-binding cassette domain-containing protein [Anoxybacillus flavithermus]MBE2908741.1 ABC-F family ATP-binding cassette domain-containing protein [Anoxybacillus flavithermus]MBE2911386.1 ABC-F family ATP-binding cassette domain-con
MIILQVNQLSKSYGAEQVLSDIKLEIQEKDRIALVGRNGAGKSTLLKIIAGQLSYDTGEIIKPKHVTIGYLDQYTGLQAHRSIWEEMLDVFAPLQQMEKQLRELEQQMSLHDADYERLLEQYDRLQTEFKEKGGYQYEADIRSVLHGLRFSQYDYTTKVSTLSGGQRTRLALGKLLLTRPDLLILDEPTNHLDMETLQWLEQYLKNYDGAILIVSHDRYFLDQIVTQVYELSRTKIKKYVGNYTSYLQQRAEQFEQQLKLYEKQQEEITKLKDFIQRNIARASTTKRAQSRRKQLEKMNIIDKPLGDEKSASFRFEIERPSGNDVLTANDLAIGYDHIIAKNLSFRITRGDSIALIGPNGIGKSTLLKTIIKQLHPKQGEIRYGTNVQIGYYDQEQAQLTSNKRVIDELWDEDRLRTEKEIRTILGNFLFSGDDVLKPVQTLSGGEKARLALAKLMMKKANVLVLDEPTNHLDLDSKEVLEQALIEYPGTIIFVSHDRYFINKIATKIYELSTDGLVEYLGDYDYYVAKKAELLELGQISQKTKTGESLSPKRSYEEEKERKKLERQRQRKIEQLETEMERIEQQIATYEQQLYDPSCYNDYEKARDTQGKIDELKQKFDELFEQWELLQK